MAIYEYLCRQCREVFEVTRPMSKSNKLANCPKCSARGEKLPSVFSSTADSNVKGPDKDAFRGLLKPMEAKAKNRGKASVTKNMKRKAG